MMPRAPFWIAFAILLGACAGPGPGGQAPVPPRAPDFKPAEVRQPAVFVRFAFGRGEFSDRERASLATDYEGVLLEALNARGVPARDVRLVAEGGTRLDAAAALARAREVQADHAVIVDVRVARDVAEFCRETRRAPLRATATIWDQGLTVLRVSDGAQRLLVEPGGGLAVTDVAADCDDPKASRRRAPEETLTHAVDRLLARLLGA